MAKPKPKEPRVYVGIRMERELRDQVFAQARKEYLGSATVFVCKVLREYLDKAA